MKLEYYRAPCGRQTPEPRAENNRKCSGIEASVAEWCHRTLFAAHSESRWERCDVSRTSSSHISCQSLWLLAAISCTFACLVVAASQPSGTQSNEPMRYNLRQLRYRLHSPHSQHKRHHYYQHSKQHSHHHEHTHPRHPHLIGAPTAVTTTTMVSASPSSQSDEVLPPIYLLQQSLSRHRHPYYFFYEHDNSTGASNQRHYAHNQTLRKWSSRQNSARLLKDRTTKVIYQLNGIQSDEQLPVCEALQVCNKVDTYSTPWIEKQCRCPENLKPCSEALTSDDGHTVAEKNKLYKTCEPVRKLPTCRYFRDITWTLTTTSAKSEHSLNSLLSSSPSHYHHHVNHHDAENITRQEMKCLCPPNSVAYIFKHQVYKAPDGQLGYRYHFACSPETKLRCKRKEPCRLFTSRKRSKVEEVNTNTLCQCPGGYSCPANHRHPSVLIGTSHPLDNFRTYSGYCYPDSSAPESDDLDATEVETEVGHRTYHGSTESESAERGHSKSRGKPSSDGIHHSKYDSQQEKHLLSLLRQ